MYFNMQALLRQIQAGDPEIMPGCAIALSSLATTSATVREILSMSGASHVIGEAAMHASSGAAHMALLQALNALSLVGPSVLTKP